DNFHCMSNAPYYPQQPGNPYGQKPQESGSAVLGVLSLLSGGASWLMCCCAPASIPCGLIAIVLGHMSLGRPASRVFGIFGLLFVYRNLLIGGGPTLFYHHAGPPPEPAAAMNARLASNPAKEALHKAELTIMSGDADDYVRGNSPEAKEAAQEFADLMKLLRD